MREVFGELDCEVGGIGELERMGIAGEFEMDDLVAGGALVVSLQHLETAVFAVPVDRFFKVADADSSVEKFDHIQVLYGAIPVCQERMRKSRVVEWSTCRPK